VGEAHRPDGPPQRGRAVVREARAAHGVLAEEQSTAGDGLHGQHGGRAPPPGQRRHLRRGEAGEQRRPEQGEEAGVAGAIRRQVAEVEAGVAADQGLASRQEGGGEGIAGPAVRRRGQGGVDRVAVGGEEQGESYAGNWVTA
jgi:hypothetical protein